MPTDPETEWTFLPVHGHRIANVWESELSGKIFDDLDSKGSEVKWRSIDVCRIRCREGYPASGPIIWIGINPGSLSRDVGTVAALKCRKTLREHEFPDVEVEIHEMTYWPDFTPPKPTTCSGK